MDLGIELGENMGDRLELADLLSELLALLGVRERPFEGRGGDAERVRAELEVLDVEDRHELTPPRSRRRRAAENVVPNDANVVEMDRANARPLVAELLDAPDRDPGLGRVDDYERERRGARRLRIAADEHDQAVRYVSRGDERLFATHHEPVAVPSSGRANRREVRSGTRLGERQCDHAVTPRDPRKKSLALLFRSQPAENLPAVREKERRREPDRARSARRFLDHEQSAERIRTAAPMARVDRQAEETRLTERPHHGGGKLVRGVETADFLARASLGENAPRALPDHRLLVAQLEVDHRRRGSEIAPCQRGSSAIRTLANPSS